MANALSPSFSSPTPERQARGVVPPRVDDAISDRIGALSTRSSGFLKAA